MTRPLQTGGAQTIDQVIQQLDEVIAWSISEKSRLGYFAALYRRVTVQVKEGISKGQFQDGPRMERLDVIFANRYLTALDAYLNGKPCSKSWLVAFRAAEQKQQIILQHLLLGMNAHINLDLGIAAAETCPGDQIESLHDDFMAINTILASLVDEVESEINELSPWINLLDHISPKASDAIVNFSMQKARDFAWDFALKLAPADASGQHAEISVKDIEMDLLGQIVAKPPGFLLRFGLWVIRLRESSDIVRNIQMLNRKAVVVPFNHPDKPSQSAAV
ncbi:DUF5995 family protein [Brevibacillus dissolubilis]|uniref:DUF5995 family protein n=1 Tax=Brevibacillus dissolubilis TaxID=1844116 RepID=UPI00159BB57A|nr:DUF5995 family protein [Brevibacillus dissolubilis]